MDLAHFFKGQLGSYRDAGHEVRVVQSSKSSNVHSIYEKVV